MVIVTKNEIIFKKYGTRGADYHYRQLDKKNLLEYNSFVEARFAHSILLAKQFLKKTPKKKIKILDVGCGDAVFFSLLCKSIGLKNTEFHGVDLSQDALRIARKKIPSGKFIKTTVYNLPYKENFFDFVFSSDVIEHVADQKRMLKEMVRVGKKGCLYVIGTPIRVTEKPLDKMHYHEFFPEEFFDFLNRELSSVKVFERMLLIDFLRYEKTIKIFNRQIPFNRYVMNFLSMMGRNPFILHVKKKPGDYCSYMLGVGKK